MPFGGGVVDKEGVGYLTHALALHDAVEDLYLARSEFLAGGKAYLNMGRGVGPDGFACHGLIHYFDKLERADLLVPEAVRTCALGLPDEEEIRGGGHHYDLYLGIVLFYGGGGFDTALAIGTANIHQHQPDMPIGAIKLRIGCAPYGTCKPVTIACLRDIIGKQFLRYPFVIYNQYIRHIMSSTSSGSVIMSSKLGRLTNII